MRKYLLFFGGVIHRCHILMGDDSIEIIKVSGRFSIINVLQLKEYT